MMEKDGEKRMIDQSLVRRIETWTWPFLMMVLALVAIVLPLPLGLDSVAYGDHASNSMLVAEAKSLSLLHGNYSRVGFYHPGPYFFFIMATGELVFYDILGIAQSPEAAHRLAIGFQNLFLLTLAYRLIRADETPVLVAALASMLGLAVLADQAPVLSSLWPPNMYVLPAFLFTVSMWRFIDGDVRALPVLVFSGSILVHGHASQIGLVPIMAFGACVCFLCARKLSGEANAPHSLFDWIKTELIRSAIVLTVFILPIFLHTLINWPGEIPKYFAMSGGSPNALMPSLAYLGQYWAAWPWLFIIAVVGFVLARSLGGQSDTGEVKSFDRGAFSLAAVLAITTFAMMFYSVRGIDDLSLPYIGLWYLGSVGAIMALAWVLFLKRARAFKRFFLALGAVTVMVSGLSLTVFSAQPHLFAETNTVERLNNDGAAVDDILQTISAQSSANRLRLDLDSETDWTTIWPAIAGVVNRAQRTGLADPCIMAEDWHVLFHARARCEKPNSLSMAPDSRWIVTTQDLPQDGYTLAYGFDTLHAFRNIKIFRPKTLNEAPIDLGRPGDKLRVKQVLQSGWSRIEGPFVWQTQVDATLDLSGLIEPVDGEFKLDLISNLPPNVESRTIAIISGGQILHRETLSAPETEHSIRFEVTKDTIGSLQALTIRSEQMYAPSEWAGKEADTTKLGVGLRAVSFTRASDRP